MTKEELIKRKMEILQEWEDNINRFIYDPKVEKEYREICEQIEQMEDND